MHQDAVPVVDSAAIVRLDSLERAGWASEHPREFCEESRVLAARLVGDPAKATALADPCDMPNEWPVNLRRHFEHHFAGVQRLDIPKQAVTRVRVPVLTIHGTWDRNAPYGAGREWALTLPNARLITVERAAHQVVTDAPDIVLPAIEEFVSGRWPARAEKIRSLEPAPR
ncbi:MAG TPA: alpha/beta hydrolase [Gemmatimonadales bacterium]